MISGRADGQDRKGGGEEVVGKARLFPPGTL